MKNWVVILFMLSTPYLFAQKEGNNWCFGEYAVISFNTGKPVKLKSSDMYARLGSGAISSSNGRLLFYANGRSIWDSSYTSFIDLNNGGAAYANSAQPALFVPWPDSSHLYYIFTPANGDDTIFLQYSVLNMKLRGGLGGVISGKKNLKLPIVPLGKINAVRHPNKIDYWLAVPQANTDSVHIYLITPQGIKLPAVKSKIGIKFKSGLLNYKNSFGYIKFSPDGKKLCSISHGDTSFIADFDATTGRLSNIWRFSAGNGISLEFSPKSRFLYVCNFNSRVSQYDIQTPNEAAFLASRITVDSGDYTTYSQSCLQVATDGKIYISFSNTASSPPSVRHLNVIHAPDSIGKKARVQRNYFHLGGQDFVVNTGLPDFIQSFFHKPNFGVRQNCANDSVFFTIKDDYKLDSVHWDFGDPASGSKNYSTQTKNVFHYYKTLGNYKARLISFHKGYTDTIYETFLLKPLKPNIGKDTNFCSSKFLLLSPSQEYAAYKWSNNQTVKSIYVTNPGTYYLTVSNYEGCKGMDTIVVTKPIVKADFTANDMDQCLRNNSFKLKETTSYKDALRKQSRWILEDSMISNDSALTLNFDKGGAYKLKLISESNGGCSDSIIKTITVNAIPKASFSINGSMQCFNTHSYDFKINKDTGKVSYEWDLGDQSFSNPGDVMAKKYAKEGGYKIRLIATTDKNCKDTLVKPIIVLPAPKADFNWDLACSRTITNFKYTGSKPIASFSWNLNNEAFSTLENPSQLFSTTGPKKIKLWVMADNACLDTISKTMDVKKQAKAEFEVKDVCENDSVAFNNTSKDATGYNWKFGDGKSSTLENTKHKYQITSSTTFNVSLVAVVSGGCSDSIGKAVTVNENPKSDFSYTQAAGGKVDFKASQTIATNYRWLFGNGDTAKVTNPNYSYTYKKSSNYAICLKVTNAAACQSETCKQLAITGGMASLNKPTGFKIYPNPNSGNFTIEIDNPGKDVSIEVYNSLGSLVERVEKVEKVTSLNLDLATGVYLVRVMNGAEVWNQKVVVSVGDTKR